MKVDINGIHHRVENKRRIVEILMQTSMDKVVETYMSNFAKRARQFRSQTIHTDSIDTFIADLNYYGYIKILEN